MQSIWKHLTQSVKKKKKKTTSQFTILKYNKDMVKQLEGQKQWDGHVLGEHVDMCHQVMGWAAHPP